MESDKKAIIECMEIESEEPEAMSEKPAKISWTQLVIAPVIFFLFVGYGTFVVVSEEWVRATVKDEYFPSTGIRSNFSTCDVVNKSDPDYLNYKTVQQTSAQWLMYYRYSDNIPALVMSLVLPSYSDSLGRKKILIVSMIGLFVVVCGTTIIMFTKASLSYLVAFYIFQGLTGSLHGFAAVSFAYIADITKGSNQRRIQAIIFLDFLYVASGLVASPLSGLLVETIGLGFPNTGAICISLIVFSVVLACVFLPETLPKSSRQPITSFSMALKQTVAFFTSADFKNNKLPIGLLLVAFFFNELSISSRNGIEILYLLGQPFCWGPSYIGYYGLVQRAVLGILGLAAVKVLLRFFSSCTVSIFSCISSVASLVTEAVARSDALMYCTAVIGLLGFLTVPLIRGMVSTMTSQEKQGAAFASLGLIQALGALASVLENEIYAATLSIMNGFVFLCLAMFVGVELLLLLFFRHLQKNEGDKNEKEPEKVGVTNS